MVLKLKFGQDFEAELGHDSKAEVGSKILKLNFGQVFKAEVWSRL